MLKKRFTMRLEHPNPLFEVWLKEWRDEAIEKDSKMQHCYGKALQSLRKYPLPLATGRECIILQGFGQKLCQMLDDKLVQHTRSNLIQTNNCSKKSPKTKEYVPALRSGAWAILITLYKKSLEPQYPGFMVKPDIIKNAQCLCDKSFVKPEPGSYYTAWSSMKTLIDKSLVTKINSPAKYSLVDKGVLLAYKLYTNSLKNNDILPENKNHKNVSPKNLKEINSNKETKTAICKKKGISPKQSSSTLNLNEDISDGQPKYNLSQEEMFICEPQSFDIIFLVDKMEVNGNRHPLDDTLLAELANTDCVYEVRHLKVGDYTWICRDRATNKELVLPYVVERKRMDDFGKSIKDGRFHEQKFRLKQCGIKNVIYLIESFGNNTYTGLPLSTLYQAAINTFTHDGFDVKFTNSTKGTVKYFTTLTKLFKNLYKNKTLVSCPKGNLLQAVNDDDLVSLMTFQEFNLGASKNKSIKVQDMFVRMLLQLKGMSVDKALAIAEKYPTPHMLRLAYTEDDQATNEKLLANLEYGTLKKKIGPCISKTIYQLFQNVTY